MTALLLLVVVGAESVDKVFYIDKEKILWASLKNISLCGLLFVWVLVFCFHKQFRVSVKPSILGKSGGSRSPLEFVSF